VRGSWTADDIPDLSRRVAFVTGANSGIGYEIARELARKRAHVILACRRADRAAEALERIRFEVHDADVESLSLDLASLESVRRCAARFLDRFSRLDILICNAGVMLVPYGTTRDGFELHFGTNHLGHFALTGFLLEHLLTTPGSRIVSVTSAAYRYGDLDFGNLMFEGGRGYARFRAYARSKLANLLFALELDRRLAGTDCSSLAAHPGGAATGLGRHMGDRSWYQALLPLLTRLSQSASRGALPILRAATDPDAVGGTCFGPSGLLGMRGAPIQVPNCRRIDARLSRLLWEVSEQLTGVSFPQDGGEHPKALGQKLTLAP
jgi:NAD(P)-dependent dehydrogenase (short-subunit alcohol dehydrogenase family)